LYYDIKFTHMGQKLPMYASVIKIKIKTYYNNNFVKNNYFSSDLDQTIHLTFEMFICHFVTHNIHHTTDYTDIEL